LGRSVQNLLATMNQVLAYLIWQFIFSYLT
jgi:hypothetical protein